MDIKKVMGLSDSLFHKMFIVWQIFCEPSPDLGSPCIRLCVWVCESYVVHHRPVLCTTGLHCAPKYSISMFDNEHANQGLQCSSVLIYTLVVHNIALYRLRGAQDDFACSLSTSLFIIYSCLSYLSCCLNSWKFLVFFEDILGFIKNNFLFSVASYELHVNMKRVIGLSNSGFLISIEDEVHSENFT